MTVGLPFIAQHTTLFSLTATGRKDIHDASASYDDTEAAVRTLAASG